MEESERKRKFYSIAEDFNVYRSIGTKLQTIRELKEAYGPNISLKDMEEQLWAERNRIVERIKSQL